MCKVLENRSQQDEERMDQLTNQLKEARLLAEDADGKSDEVILTWNFIKFPISRNYTGKKFKNYTKFPTNIVFTNLFWKN